MARVKSSQLRAWFWFQAKESCATRSHLTKRAQMKWEVKGAKEIENTLMGRERKNSNTSPPLLQSCVKALTGVV